MTSWLNLACIWCNESFHQQAAHAFLSPCSNMAHPKAEKEKVCIILEFKKDYQSSTCYVPKTENTSYESEVDPLCVLF